MVSESPEEQSRKKVRDKKVHTKNQILDMHQKQSQVYILYTVQSLAVQNIVFRNLYKSTIIINNYYNNNSEKPEAFRERSGQIPKEKVKSYAS